VRNPRTGERIKARKTAVPKFSAGAELKAVLFVGYFMVPLVP
jgi:DNA-binding protein HU-beta